MPKDKWLSTKKLKKQMQPGTLWIVDRDFGTCEVKTNSSSLHIPKVDVIDQNGKIITLYFGTFKARSLT